MTVSAAEHNTYTAELPGNQGEEENTLGRMTLFDGEKQMSSKGEKDPLLVVQVLCNIPILKWQVTAIYEFKACP